MHSTPGSFIIFKLIQNWRNRRIIKRSSISPEQWTLAISALPLLEGLSNEELKRLQELVILFLYNKVFEGAHGLQVSQHMALLISLQACLPILNLGMTGYNGWTSVIVYPAGFSPERVVTDEFGVVHHTQSDLSGEAWQRGPVVLAWNEVETAGIIDGQNLVVHEFAHKLDMQNGVANGFPPLHAGMRVDDWIKAFTDGFEHFQYQCETGRSHDINCYGATSPAEFFAVLSEVFFERPAVINHHYSSIYEQLRQYYRQDTMMRLGQN